MSGTSDRAIACGEGRHLQVLRGYCAPRTGNLNIGNSGKEYWLLIYGRWHIGQGKEGTVEVAPYQPYCLFI